MHKIIIFVILFFFLPDVKSSVPGTFFWKPRLGLFLGKPTDKTPKRHEPTKENIHAELVILINGYHVGTTVLGVVAGYYAYTKPYLHLHPLSAYFYTNVYRWALRHLTLLPEWLGSGGPYLDTHKVWRRRYYFMDSFVPKWMRVFLPWVKKSEWEKEEKEYKKYKEIVEPVFGRHYTFPGKKFNDYKSQVTNEYPV